MTMWVLFTRYGIVFDATADDAPDSRWTRLARIERWATFDTPRETAPCRVVGENGQSVDTTITRELWEQLRPEIERHVVYGGIRQRGPAA